MAKKVKKILKLQIVAGKATPAPPVGTALGPAGINIAEFCKEFNDRTKDQDGMILPTVISVYDDRSYTFIVKTPPVAVLIKKALGLSKGSPEPNKNKIATLSLSQLRDIAEKKMPDLNAHSIENAETIVAGTARSMGVLVEQKQ